MYTLGLVRIAFGLLIVAWTISLLPNLTIFFGSVGVMGNHGWRPDNATLVAGWAVLLMAAAALTVGMYSRLAAVTVFGLVMFFQQSNPFVFNSGDGLIKIEALFLALSPCGAALSVDRLRSVGSCWTAEVRPQWPVRLLQVQFSLIYLSTVLVKLRGETWPDGTATSYALRLSDMVIVPIPEEITTNPLLMNAATWGTLAVELALGVLVWIRTCRPWVLGAGLVLHLSILVTLGVGFFSLAMFVLYLAFVPPRIARRPLTTIRSTLRRRSLGDVSVPRVAGRT